MKNSNGAKGNYVYLISLEGSLGELLLFEANCTVGEVPSTRKVLGVQSVHLTGCKDSRCYFTLRKM